MFLKNFTPKKIKATSRFVIPPTWLQFKSAFLKRQQSRIYESTSSQQMPKFAPLVSLGKRHEKSATPTSWGKFLFSKITTIYKNIWPFEIRGIWDTGSLLAKLSENVSKNRLFSMLFCKIILAIYLSDFVHIY